MKLFLTSSTITPNLVGPFEDLIGKSINGLSVVFINDAMHAPDAGNTPQQIEQYTTEDVEQLLKYSWELDVMTIKDEQDLSYERFSQYDVIYMNGVDFLDILRT